MGLLGKLKEKAGDKAKAQVMAQIEQHLGPEVTSKLDMFKELKPADVKDDEKYSSIVVVPGWKAIAAQVGPVAGLAKKAGFDLEEKFSSALFHVRDELIHVEDDKVKLDDDFNSKLVPTLMDALKK